MEENVKNIFKLFSEFGLGDVLDELELRIKKEASFIKFEGRVVEIIEEKIFWLLNGRQTNKIRITDKNAFRRNFLSKTNWEEMPDVLLDDLVVYYSSESNTLKFNLYGGSFFLEEIDHYLERDTFAEAVLDPKEYASYKVKKIFSPLEEKGKIKNETIRLTKIICKELENSEEAKFFLQELKEQFKGMLEYSNKSFSKEIL